MLTTTETPATGQVVVVYRPTGEVRPPKRGEFYHDSLGVHLKLTDAAMEPLPIYRKVKEEASPCKPLT